MIRVTEVKLNLDQAINKDEELQNIRLYLRDKYKISNFKILSIYKKAIDARKKSAIVFVYTVDFTTDDDNRLLRLKDKHIIVSPDMDYQEVEEGNIKLRNRPIIVGFGPSGIFSALLLARRGYKPLIIEMGLDIDKRDEAYYEFINSRVFKKEASIQFGEGGAGTYSDGKLTTSISDLRSRFVLNTLVEFGADEDLVYINKPHVGTDKLKTIIKAIRKEIINFGGEIRFASQLTDLIIKNGKLVAIEINNNQIIETEILLLGIGHSSRETFELIKNKGFNLSRKPFAVGLRIEHPQELIDKSQYGEYYNHPSLKPADYKLSYHDDNGRSAYSFCMCPGGYVMCGSSEAGGVVTNGMSESKRDNFNANSALLVNVTPDDFPNDDVLAGMYFQRELEQSAFVSAGSNYNAPSQLVSDFLNNRKSKALGDVKHTYQPGIEMVNLNDILPKFISDTLKKAIVDFDRKIKGFAMPDALLTGIETRSSSPIRIIRNDDFETNIKGVYSMGEGAGYAGGIMSSAVDGIKTAEAIIKKYQKF